MSRRHRWFGIAGIGVRRIVIRGVTDSRTRVFLSIFGVVIAVAMLLVVTGLAVGLAMETTVHGDNVDYVLTPASLVDEPVVAAPDNPQFADVHPTMETILDDEAVTGGTPVLLQVSSMETSGGEHTHVLIIGIVPEHAPETVAGLPTTPLSNETAYHDSGEWTGEAVISEAGATVLGIDTGAEVLGPSGDRSYTITSVAEPRGADAIAGTPVALVHLGELQAEMGVAEHDQAHQFLIQASSPAAAERLETIYPGAHLSTQTGLTAGEVVESDLPLALSGTALVVAIITGVLFVTTAMGLEMMADRRQLQTLAAIGLSRRSRFTIVSTQTVLVVAIGGILGTLLGYAGITVLNSVVATQLPVAGVARSPWWLAPYGGVVAISIVLVTMPYLAYLTIRHTDPEVPD